MPDLLSILNGAQTSLAAQRALTATASHNIDNANTPGYARQRANLEALAPAEAVRGAYIGRGATLGSVTQARDTFLERQIPAALGSSARSAAEADALAAFHGLDPEAQGNLTQALGAFYSGLRALAQNPSDPTLRTSFLGASRVLAASFGRTAQGIEAARAGADAQVSDLAGQVTAEARQVALLNTQIRQARAGGGEPNDLLDARQTHLDKLAELAGTTAIPASSGDVDVTLANGTALVSGGRAGAMTTIASGDRGHLNVRVTQPDGSPLDVPRGGVGGAVGGALDARDGALLDAGAAVNALAQALGTSVNAVHAAGAGLDGSTGAPLFSLGSDPARAAENMAVAVADPRALALAAVPTPPATVAPGDASNATALLATERAALPPPLGKDPVAALSGLTASFGSSAASAKALADNDGAMKDHLVALRDSTTGVSIDEEMIALQAAQRGYEAITKVIRVADEMLQTLMSLK